MQEAWKDGREILDISVYNENAWKGWIARKSSKLSQLGSECMHACSARKHASTKVVIAQESSKKFTAKRLGGGGGGRRARGLRGVGGSKKDSSSRA
jgi:hypothetical protein